MLDNLYVFFVGCFVILQILFLVFVYRNYLKQVKQKSWIFIGFIVFFVLLPYLIIIINPINIGLYGIDKIMLHWSVSIIPLISVCSLGVVLFYFVSFKNLEKRIWNNELRYRKLIDAIPDLVFVTNNEYELLRVNKAFADKFGISPKDAIGQTCYKLIHGADQPPPYCFVHTNTEEGKKKGEMYEKNLGGNYHITATPLYDQKGNISSMAHVFRDVTDYKNLEEIQKKKIKELEKSSAEIQTLSGLIPICASCKKIRDREGLWNQLEEYISKHSTASFTHTLCPDCAKEIHPGLFDE